MKLLCRILSCLVVPALFLAATPQSAHSAENGCDPDFPLKDGWLGGDGVYSVALGDGRTLWLFGDSFIAAPLATDRHDAALISNSAAISRCGADGRFEITYHWQKEGGEAKALFTPPETPENRRTSVRYWPLDGHAADGALWIFLMRVETRDPSNPLGFAVTGTDLARIANPEDDPARWKMEIQPLAREPALTGSAIIPRHDTLLLASPLEEGSHPVLLTRLPLPLPDQKAAATLETLVIGERDTDQPPSWMPGLDIDTAARIIPAASSEMSLDPDPRGEGWISIHMEPLPFSRRIVMREAPEPWGPWSQPTLLFEIPDQQPGGNALEGKASEEKAGSSVFCYAGKAHRQFAGDAPQPSLLLTYACNSLRFENLLEDTSLYRPHAVRIALP